MKFTGTIILLITLFASPLFGGVGNIASTEERTNYIRIDNGAFKCTFFPGHFFPVWFETPAGEKYPNAVRYFDRVTITTGKKKMSYALWRDLWVEQKIVTNTPEKFVIECRGSYCSSDFDKVPPGNYRAMYRYEITRNSPEIKIYAEIKRDTEKPVEMIFFQPAWDLEVFDEMVVNGKSYDISGDKKYRFGPVRDVRFRKNDLEIALRFYGNHRNLTALSDTGDGFTTAWMRRMIWKSRGLNFTAFIAFRKVNQE